MNEETEYILNMLPCKHADYIERIKTFDAEKQERINKQLGELIKEGYVAFENDSFVLTEKGRALLEEAKRKMQELVAQAKEYEIEPGGGIIRELRFVYEPLNEREIVYNWNGKRGIAEIKEAKGGLYYIEVEKKRFWIKGKPLSEKEFIFMLPDRDRVVQWVSDGKAKSTEEIRALIENTLKTFLDLGDEYLYKLATLSVFQSWFRHVLPVVFYTAFFGEWGGGKTTSGEVITALSYHGYFISNTSVPFVGRCVDRLKITPFLDELDASSNEELLAIIRQGYRRGLKYSRMSEHGEKPQSFENFAPWVFSVHGMTEEALLSRTFPITLASTSDKRLPILNIYKQYVLPRVYTDIFLWYMSNILSIVDQIDQIDQVDLGEIVDQVLQKEGEKGRERLWGVLVKSINMVNQLEPLTGRDIELGYILMKIAEAVGIDLEIKKVMELRTQAVEEIREVGVMGLFRDWIVKKYEELKDRKEFRNSLGEFMISNKDAYNLFNDYLKANKNVGISPSAFKAMVSDFGFSGDARKKMKVPLIDNLNDTGPRLALIFTPRPCRRLGINYTEMVEYGKKIIEQKTLEGGAERGWESWELKA